MKKHLILVLLLSAGLILGCATTQQETATTTTVSTTTTTTSPSSATIRLYYTFPTVASKSFGGKDYSSQNFGSAYSSDGINFTKDPGIRLGPLANLTDPDVFKEGSNKWVLFYSKAVSSDPAENSKLFKATSSTPNGSFEVDNIFAGGELGNISSTIKIGNTFYVYLVNNGIKIATCNPTTNGLTLVGTGPAGAADPSVIQLSSNSFKMYYKLSGDTYCAGSTDGLNWGSGTSVVSYAEVPGAVYVNNKVYLYYGDSKPGSSTLGKNLVIISSDNGATFSLPEAVIGLHDAACDPNPVAYE